LNPFNRTEKLCRLMSGEGVKVVVGPKAMTDGTTVMIPPIPIGADEIDVLIHESAIAHEPAHITEKSFAIKLDAKGKLHHFCWNVIEDVRIENNQEQRRYFGLRVWRAEFIKAFQSVAVKLGSNKVFAASDVRNAVNGALTLLYLRGRAKQLGVVTNVKTSPKVEEVYQRTCAGFFDEVVKAEKLSEIIDLAGRIFEAVRKMLKEEAEKAAKEKAAREKATREKAEKQRAEKEKAEKKPKSKPEPEDSDDDEPEDKDTKDSEGDEPEDSKDSEGDEPEDSKDSEGDESEDKDAKDSDDG